MNVNMGGIIPDDPALPTLAVVTVSKNYLQGLKRTCRSVDHQRFRDVQHVIVDGGSNDGSREWLTSLAPNHRRDWSSQEDDGIYHAMNIGLARVDADLVVFMNSGDTFSDADTLSFVAEDWRRNRWNWGFGAVRYVDSRGEPSFGHVSTPIQWRKLAYGLTFVPHQAAYFETDFIVGLGGYSPEYGLAADQELIIRAMAKSRPAEWIRFMVDFEMGGVTSTVSTWAREKMWHKIRRGNGLMLANSLPIDYSATVGLAAYRISRRRLASVVRGSSSR